MYVGGQTAAEDGQQRRPQCGPTVDSALRPQNCSNTFNTVEWVAVLSRAVPRKKNISNIPHCRRCALPRPQYLRITVGIALDLIRPVGVPMERHGRAPEDACRLGILLKMEVIIVPSITIMQCKALSGWLKTAQQPTGCQVDGTADRVHRARNLAGARPALIDDRPVSLLTL